MSELAAAALAYAQRGISVFPLKPRSKEPVTPNGFKQATADVDQVRAWWRKRPDCNIGIATGAPAGFWVLDVDGEDAERALEALEAANGRLPETVQQMTGRGRHLCFLWDPAGPEMRNRSKVGGADIDVRGNGGYIVAPPSIHPGDAKKGVPAGRRYGWCFGRAPEDMAFAVPPAWLVELCRPRDQVAAAPAVRHEAAPRADGRASRYGEAVLETCVRTIVQAQKGARDSTLYRFACKAAGLVPTGHLQAGYLREALIHAGRVHVPDAMTEAQLARQVERALVWGEAHPWGPDPDRRQRSAVRAGGRSGPVEQAVARADGLKALEATHQGPNTEAVVRSWLQMAGLRADGVPGALARVRVTGAGRSWAGAMGLQAGPNTDFDGLATFALRGAGGCSGLKGLSEGRVAILAWPEGADQVLVATTLGDAWALAEAAFDSGDPMAVVVAPRLSTFAGAPLGDRWGRVNAETPQPDPARPAWTRAGMAAVYLAVRRDLAGPELRIRKPLGGTRRLTLEGEPAAKFWGGLAAASWKAAGVNAVRVLRPPAGRVGFCELGEGA